MSIETDTTVYDFTKVPPASESEQIKSALLQRFVPSWNSAEAGRPYRTFSTSDLASKLYWFRPKTELTGTRADRFNINSLIGNKVRSLGGQFEWFLENVVNDVDDAATGPARRITPIFFEEINVNGFPPYFTNIASTPYQTVPNKFPKLSKIAVLKDLYDFLDSEVWTPSAPSEYRVEGWSRFWLGDDYWIGENDNERNGNHWFNFFWLNRASKLSAPYKPSSQENYTVLGYGRVDYLFKISSINPYITNRETFYNYLWKAHFELFLDLFDIFEPVLQTTKLPTRSSGLPLEAIIRANERDSGAMPAQKPSDNYYKEEGIPGQSTSKQANQNTRRGQEVNNWWTKSANSPSPFENRGAMPTPGKIVNPASPPAVVNPAGGFGYFGDGPSRFAPGAQRQQQQQQQQQQEKSQVDEIDLSSQKAAQTRAGNPRDANVNNSSVIGYKLYIQYTLICNGFPVELNGGYNPGAVERFQRAKNIVSDGVVDSETKSVMATFWLNIYKNDRTKYQTLLAAAPNQAKVYIENAVKYSDISAICNPSSSDEYRRISYTGFEGPTSIQDYIVIRVPKLKNQNGQFFPWQELVSIDISTGGWPCQIKQIYLYEQNLSQNSHVIPQFGSGAIKALAQNIINASKSIASETTVKIPAGNKRRINYIMLEVIGSKLKDGVHGPYAEGFSIRDVSFTVKTPGVPTASKDPSYVTLAPIKTTAKATFTMYGSTEVDSGDIGVFNLGTIAAATASAARSKVTDINLKSINLSVKPLKDGQPILDADKKVVERNFSKQFDRGIYSPGTNLLSTAYKWEQDGCTVDVSAVSKSTVIDEANPVILAVQKQGPTEKTSLSPSEISQQFAILTNSAPKYIITTSNGVEIISTERDFIYDVDNYYIADADINGLNSKQNIKLSINAKDGVVVLTDNVGNPVGIPNYNEFIQPGLETSFGTTMLRWNLKDSNGILTAPPSGLQWGFYNIRTKQFLGIKLSYQYYMNNKRDIYIGVHAFDADRDESTKDNILGVENRNQTLVELPFPAKSICPVYSVRISPRAKIAISSPPNNLSKFDTWFINLSRGRFYKKITIPMSYNFVDWKRNYKGKELRCFYDSTKIQAPYSVVFGTGYYDIWEENPIILSENEIQLRHGSFLTVQEQVNKEGIDSIFTDASDIVPWIEVEVKNSSGQWQKINKNLISNYNKHIGRVSFSRSIVPSDENKIRVNYTVKNPNVMLYHINGKEIPLNPYSSFSGTTYDASTYSLQLAQKQNRPMHFYLLPVMVEELVDGEYVEIPFYDVSQSVINYTYKYDIFNSGSIDYDPFALYIGSAVINDSFNLENVQLLDLRVKGGGISHSTSVQKESDKNKNILYFNDIRSGKGFLYPSGGYVIVRIPSEVKQNFASIDQVYGIVRSNLTAGVAFDIQDMSGNDWRAL